MDKRILFTLIIFISCSLREHLASWLQLTKPATMLWEMLIRNKLPNTHCSQNVTKLIVSITESQAKLLTFYWLPKLH